MKFFQTISRQHAVVAVVLLLATMAFSAPTSPEASRPQLAEVDIRDLEPNLLPNKVVCQNSKDVLSCTTNGGQCVNGQMRPKPAACASCSCSTDSCIGSGGRCA